MTEKGLNKGMGTKKEGTTTRRWGRNERQHEQLDQALFGNNPEAVLLVQLNTNPKTVKILVICMLTNV